MSEHSEPFEGDKSLHKDKVHEENKKEEQQMHQRENQNPNLEKEHNPIRHNAGGR